MIFIAHRGNLDGPNPERENHPEYIEKALKAGYDVEVDVWKTVEPSRWFLGHVGLQYPIEESFLDKIHDHAWFHAKNVFALNGLLALGFRCFFHVRDAHTLTSDGYIWTYPGETLTSRSIDVMPESYPFHAPRNTSIKPAGICTDIVKYYKKRLG